ncbi:hypothetical protein PV04_03835 [Phialophora macrospora]|uniref:DUF924-domain-containing protein n=1 Tax=Phialophora macrospora TaxID=1851006 RepID=A0A0D2FYY9_9EURO|nr:hypothetical protein PV04_03835 [Phialophora macrospora]
MRGLVIFKISAPARKSADLNHQLHLQREDSPEYSYSCKSLHYIDERRKYIGDPSILTAAQQAHVCSRMKVAIDQALTRLLQVQSAFQSYISPLFYYSTTSVDMAATTPQISTAHQADITRILDYWFTPSTPGASITEKWFRPPNRDQVDEEIRTNFEPLIQQARNDSLDNWATTPLGSIALIILLDQFPRNIYRGSPLSYASDAKAVDVAVQCIAREFDQSPDVTELQAMFFYMPLMHAESVIHQIAGIGLFELLAARCLTNTKLSAAEREEVTNFVVGSRHFAKAHRDVIMRFGRFPSRNEVLGRPSTPEEVQFLKDNPGGFAMGGSGR